MSDVDRLIRWAVEGVETGVENLGASYRHNTPSMQKAARSQIRSDSPVNYTGPSFSDMGIKNPVKSPGFTSLPNPLDAEATINYGVGIAKIYYSYWTTQPQGFFQTQYSMKTGAYGQLYRDARKYPIRSLLGFVGLRLGLPGGGQIPVST